MNLITAFVNKKNNVGYKKAVQASLKYISNGILSIPYYISGLIDYHLNPNALKQKNIISSVDYEKIKTEFIDNGFEIIDYEIDKTDFNQWIHEVNFPEKYSTEYGEVYTEKALEHYISSKLLDLNGDDVFVDVAAASSPWYDLAEKKYMCNSFAIDLHLPTNEDDSRLIECDATNTPFENESISKIALHCAYEMFENDADIDLIKEANRVLVKGGLMIIVPLYMSPIYHIQSNLNSNRKGIIFGKAKRVWREDKGTIRFSRHYSVESFKERVGKHLEMFDLKIYNFTNVEEMKQSSSDRVYVKFAAVFTKK